MTLTSDQVSRIFPQQKSAALLLDRLSQFLPRPDRQKTALTTFFSPELILQFYSGVYQWFFKTIILQGYRGGPGVQHFHGVPNANFYRNPYNLRFFRGGGGHFIASANIKVLGQILHP